MTADKAVYTLFLEVPKYANADDFILGLINSSIWHDIEGAGINRASLSNALRQMWNCYNYTLKDILQLSGMGCTEFAVRFIVPLRTVQHWYKGDRAIPLHTKLLICESLKLWDRKFITEEV